MRGEGGGVGVDAGGEPRGGLGNRRGRLRRGLGHPLAGLLPRLVERAARLCEPFLDHLLHLASEEPELDDAAVELAPHPPRGLGELQPRRALDLDGVAAHLREQHPARDAGDGGRDRDAEVPDDGGAGIRVAELVEGHPEAREGVEEPHVVDVVPRLVVAQARRGRQEEGRGIGGHQHDRHAGDPAGADPPEFRRHDVEAPGGEERRERERSRGRVGEDAVPVAPRHHSAPCRRSACAIRPLPSFTQASQNRSSFTGSGPLSAAPAGCGPRRRAGPSSSWRRLASPEPLERGLALVLE